MTEQKHLEQAMAGERRIVTILFCDVKGSTAMAEKLDPEEWAGIMNRALSLAKPGWENRGWWLKQNHPRSQTVRIYCGWKVKLFPLGRPSVIGTFNRSCVAGQALRKRMTPIHPGRNWRAVWASCLAKKR